jgi:hypothetical protein
VSIMGAAYPRRPGRCGRPALSYDLACLTPLLLVSAR